jgi:hypothetical protein
LIYAIAGAAGIEPTNDDIITLRINLGIGANQGLGQYILFSQNTVDIIMQHFGLSGTVELYTGSEHDKPTQQFSHGGGGTLQIYFAHNHFSVFRKQ